MLQLAPLEGQLKLIFEPAMVVTLLVIHTAAVKVCLYRSSVSCLHFGACFIVFFHDVQCFHNTTTQPPLDLQVHLLDVHLKVVW